MQNFKTWWENVFLRYPFLKFAIGGGVILLVIVVFFVMIPSWESNAPAKPTTTKSAKPKATGINGGTDTNLGRKQEAYKDKCGDYPGEGFVWGSNKCDLIGLGVEGMNAEDTVYNFIRNLSNLEVAAAQRVSHASAVVTTYSEAVKSSNSTKLVDEAQMFKRDSFKTAMQSMQIESVQSAGIAADKQQTFEVTLSVIDVTNKDFWESEKDAIYEQLWKLDKVQGDSQAAQQWLNDYLKTKMQDEKFPRKKITVTLTVEKFDEYNSGWIVSRDTDLATALSGANAKPTGSFIMEQYREYKANRAQQERSNPSPSQSPQLKG